MAKTYYQNDCNLEILKKETVAVIGYGSQGHAHALNLKDSGVNVVVGLRKNSKRVAEAQMNGLTVMEVADAVKAASVVMMLTPDETQSKIYRDDVEPYMTKGKTLMFAHGFNIHFKQIQPSEDINVIMVAPKGPGHTVRSQYVEGRGVPALIAIYQDVTGNAKDLALSYADGIGGSRAGIFETSFKEETETDLFGEQAVLCGGVSELMKAGFETLVNAGYQPEMAYFECVHELKLIIDLVVQGGLSYMRYSISDTAEYGDYQIGKRIITDETKKEMAKVLKEIQNGTFASKWMAENNAGGRANFLATRAMEQEHMVEKVGSELREKMIWLKK